MNLQELAIALKELRTDKNKDTPVEGFNNPHSYRGYYNELAFEPATTTIQEMIEAVYSAHGEEYRGYKGGNFIMGKITKVNLAYEGSCGDTELNKEWVDNLFKRGIIVSQDQINKLREKRMNLINEIQHLQEELNECVTVGSTRSLFQETIDKLTEVRDNIIWLIR